MPQIGPTQMIRILAFLLAALLASEARAQERFITLSSTTSTQDSGLFDHILPRFRAATGVSVHVVAVGTGQALAIGARGDADALLVHDRAGEDKFVADGFGIDRMELRLWRMTGVSPDPRGAWYRDLGQGMGATLNIAAALNAYTLTDRATWANFKNRQGLEILTEGDPALFNPYGSILVNPAKWPNVKYSDAKIWHEWLTSKAGLDAITSYRINGEELFFRPHKAPTN